MDTSCFNRRGDSLGGATSVYTRTSEKLAMFQSQRRFFGGSNVNGNGSQVISGYSFNRRGDSLGGATHPSRGTHEQSQGPFQSQRRFFGGSNHIEAVFTPMRAAVSIAEAILWGEQPRLSSVAFFAPTPVSIAEAILWGEQLRFPGSMYRQS